MSENNKVAVLKNCMDCSTEFSVLSGGRGRPQTRCNECRAKNPQQRIINLNTGEIKVKREKKVKVIKERKVKAVKEKVSKETKQPKPKVTQYKVSVCKDCGNEFTHEVKRGRPPPTCGVNCETILEKARERNDAVQQVIAPQLYTAEKLSQYNVKIGDKILFSGMHKILTNVSEFGARVKFMGVDLETNKPIVLSDGQEYRTDWDKLYKQIKVEAVSL